MRAGQNGKNDTCVVFQPLSSDAGELNPRLPVCRGDDEPDDSDAESEALPNFPAGASKEHASVEVGVADYFNSHPEEAASILGVKAPDVLMLARCIGAPKAANYFAGRLKCKVTEKMIKTIKSKVAKDITAGYLGGGLPTPSAALGRWGLDRATDLPGR